MGRLKGQEAVEAFAADPTSIVFDCFFENGVAKFTLNGDEISGCGFAAKEFSGSTAENVTITAGSGSLNREALD